MNPSLERKLETIVERVQEVSALLADPEVIADNNRFRDLSVETIDSDQIDDIMAGKPPRPPADWDVSDSTPGPGDGDSKSTEEKPDSKIGGPAGEH